MSESYKVVVVDDHPLMAYATKQLLDQLEHMEVVGVAATGKDCLELLEQHRPQLVFLDYQLPDMSGTEITEQIKKNWPDTFIIIFTGVDVSELVPRFLELEVSAIISKGIRHNTIKHLISCVLDNYVVIPRSGIGKLLLPPAPAVEEIDLTEDEAVIMTMIVKGCTLEQIAEQIHMSKRSVDNYQRRIYDKLGVKGRAQAIESFVRSKYYVDAPTGGAV